MDILSTATPESTPVFRLHPIEPKIIKTAIDLARINAADAARLPVLRSRAGGGEPLRCCLRAARSGEELILFNYQPPLPPSPYREAGAVYTHAEPCGGPPEAGPYPAEWLGHPQILRAHDDRGWIHPASILSDGQDLLADLEQVLATPGVVQVQIRNVAYGCLNAVATAIN